MFLETPLAEAPTASAMPVTEGLPVAWPLPTKAMLGFPEADGLTMTADVTFLPQDVTFVQQDNAVW